MAGHSELRGFLVPRRRGQVGEQAHGFQADGAIRVVRQKCHIRQRQDAFPGYQHLEDFQGVIPA